jgi:hypothetical protein
MTTYSAWALRVGLCLAALVLPTIDTGKMLPPAYVKKLAEPTPTPSPCPVGMAWSREEGCHEDD